MPFALVCAHLMSVILCLPMPVGQSLAQWNFVLKDGTSPRSCPWLHLCIIILSFLLATILPLFLHFLPASYFLYTSKHLCLVGKGTAFSFLFATA
ncbi:hypothetical protein DUNSADRAFT_10159 [Dunaliella salina]|uniref:Uncharacterized protein n=1 Tax=Dunaliella salina TaxID=3046 RepID=A0ABQ7GFX3_DUNSA|nr:hypothetical protein DUNSADRAFT_10159 [Dunaliella salina]|eukprot:KAF5833508.1 hypothetical protein DUNSADRAFT_10159 [Dunaliella salina]